MTIEEAKALIGTAEFTSTSPQNWADLGCGSGLFSKALAEFLPVDSHILCLDKDGQNWRMIDAGQVRLEFQRVDFVQETIPATNLDGILMANSLHYISDKTVLIQKLRSCLGAHGKFLVVEYDTERANRWVPYPITFSKLEKIFASLGFTKIKKIGERKSVYGLELMYAAEVSS